jgi:hypothetical protein
MNTVFVVSIFILVILFARTYHQWREGYESYGLDCIKICSLKSNVVHRTVIIVRDNRFIADYRVHPAQYISKFSARSNGKELLESLNSNFWVLVANTKLPSISNDDEIDTGEMSLLERLVYYQRLVLAGNRFAVTDKAFFVNAILRPLIVYMKRMPVGLRGAVHRAILETMPKYFTEEELDEAWK